MPKNFKLRNPFKKKKKKKKNRTEPAPQQPDEGNGWMQGRVNRQQQVGETPLLQHLGLNQPGTSGLFGGVPELGQSVLHDPGLFEPDHGVERVPQGFVEHDGRHFIDPDSIESGIDKPEVDEYGNGFQMQGDELEFDGALDTAHERDTVPDGYLGKGGNGWGQRIHHGGEDVFMKRGYMGSDINRQAFGISLANEAQILAGIEPLRHQRPGGDRVLGFKGAGVMPMTDNPGLMEPVIMTELAENGDLSDLLTKEGPLDPERALDLGHDVFSGLSFLHGLNLQHNDLKPNNIFLDGDDRGVIGDLGELSSDHGLGNRSANGTPNLKSEMDSRLRHDGKSDVLAGGLLMLDMLLGFSEVTNDDGETEWVNNRSVYHNHNEEDFERALEGDLEQARERHDEGRALEQIERVIRGMVKYNPDDRVDIDDALSMVTRSPERPSLLGGHRET